MARARRNRGRLPAIALLALVLIAIVAAIGWSRRAHHAQDHAPPVSSTQTTAVGAPITVSADRVDPANEGRPVTISGTLRADKPVRDAQLGISADALILLRDVMMRQWRERCANAKCTYTLVWAAQPMDSRGFKIAAGHQNPPRLPFSSARFFADDMHLGAFGIDAALLAGASKPVAYPVQGAQLPPNLAATFRESDGVLYAGADPKQAAAGDLRVSYRIVPLGGARMTGVQRGDRLKAASAH
jgi:hypothetical protein